jgi:hypothetical protein
MSRVLVVSFHPDTFHCLHAILHVRYIRRKAGKACPCSFQCHVEIVVSHLSVLRLLALLTNRRNQNATPVERMRSTMAFAPLNNGSTVVIMSRKKAADSIAKS